MIPNNACTLRITAAAGTKLAGAYSLTNVIIIINKRTLQPITIKVIFTAFFIHAILLDHAIAYCPKFPTAGKSLGLISVPVWLIILSNQLKIFGLVRFYHTNYLIFKKLIYSQYLTFLVLT